MGDEKGVSLKDQAAAEEMEKMMASAASPVKFAEVQDAGPQEKPRNIEFIMDIPLRLTVELGRTKVLVGELLRMSHGTVVELDKVAGEPVEVLVNGKLIASGEVVLVNDRLGIRLTDIVSQTERIKKLA